MSDPVLSAAVALREALRDFDVDTYSGAGALRLAEEFAATEKACAGARVLAASRAVRTGAHREIGFKDGPTWLAKLAGHTPTLSRQALATANRLDDCPDTKAALLAGRISLAQATEITEAEGETPGAETALLPGACDGDLSKLRERAREHLQANTKVQDLHDQQLKAQFFRHWRDRLGMVCFAGALPPETGLPLIRRLELTAYRSRRAARRTADGPPERKAFEVSTAEALVALTAGDSTSKRTQQTELVIVCDVNAWRRGHTHEDEVCHIIDGGPIPVDLAKELSKDAFISAAVHDGVQINTVRRFGRYLPAELRTALDLGPVPAFTGRQCVDCGQRWGLEYDHVDPVANQGVTSYENLVSRCWVDHQIKTEKDRQSGLLGPRAPAERSTAGIRGP